jgi:hypothetical protein
MTTVRTTTYSAQRPSSETLPTFVADSQFDQLRDFVDRAAHGEIDLEVGQARPSDAEGKLPAGWYVGPPEVAPVPLLQRTRLRPETLAGLLGLGAGLVVLVPLALWWQSALTQTVTMTPLTSSFALEAGPDVRSEAPTAGADQRIDVVSVRSVSVTKPAEDETLIEARTMLAEGEVLAARALLSKAVAARDPDGLFLMAETYDPNILAAHRARGVGADTERARALYKAAQGLGHARASTRLHALR